MGACANCGNELVKRSKEAYWQFAERKFCSRPCADKGRTTTRVPNSEFKARYRQKKLPDGTRMLEHRWVMQQHLGRRLETWEQIHHINHDRLDNRVENLEVVTTAEHAQRHTYLPVQKPCTVCGVVFTPHKTKRRRAKTCSRECLSRLQTMNNEIRRAAKNGAAESDLGAS